MIGFPLALPIDGNTPRKVSVYRRHDGKCFAQIELTNPAEYAAMAAFADAQPVAVPVQPRQPVRFTRRLDQGGFA